ncbi:MAG TPA: Nif3-like dinuclear metal center hexameric protein [Phycisphaerae bacterium]|nr:Nif3-like dinuclear metal center hexameric protein [Phycisphaerae bacterium]HUU23662.1 Nif3-like dinuclear metal center hexameric protein [Phycisphaerae bacterium]
MNTSDLHQHLLSRATWVDPGRTVDTVKAGDPSRPIRTVGVGWYASIYDLRAAAEMGCDLFITHEPTFWQHEAAEDRLRHVAPGTAKTALLAETGLVVLRCHDVWDSWPGIGIRDSWADWLGLTERVAESDHPWHAGYAIEPVPLRRFARMVAEKIAPLGEDSVSVLGDPERIVSRPALGVGCGGPDKDMVDLGADVLIVCYDGASYWATRERLVELGAAVIAVEHGTSEMPGMMNLAKYLRETFSELTVHYLDRHPRTWTVTA